MGLAKAILYSTSLFMFNCPSVAAIDGFFCVVVGTSNRGKHRRKAWRPLSLKETTVHAETCEPAAS